VASVCRIDDLTVDFARRKVFDSDHNEIALSALSFDTLQALIDASPAVLTANELIDRAWRGSVVSDETVTQRIRLLRKALQDDRRQPRYIETLRNVGYRLIPPVTEASPVEQRRTSSRVIAGVVFAAVILAAGLWLLQNDQAPETIENSAPSIPQGPVTAAELSEQARVLVRQRNPDSQGHAIELYEQALLIEPANAGILASLSMALSTSVAWYGNTHDVALRAERLARQAMTDGTFFGAEFALAFSLDSQGKVEPARAAYERAVALNPDHYGARASLAYLLQIKGKLVEALSHNMIAFEQAPAGTLDAQIASCLRLLGFYSVASEWLLRADQLDPDSAHAAPARALDLITRNEFAESREVIRNALARGVEQVELYEYQAVLALLDNDMTSARAIIDSAPPSISHRGPFTAWRHIIDAMETGVGTEAIALSNDLRSSIDAGDTWPGTLLYIAMLEAAAQRNDNAIATLLRLEAAGYRDYLWVQLLPPLQALHDDPDFQVIVASMRSDVERQRELVLTADWLPPELRAEEFEAVTP
jgi:DNA-binding winged helix-turn-helix (wHTH) protein/thioredoxin-like negative regulator of GroEL